MKTISALISKIKIPHAIFAVCVAALGLRLAFFLISCIYVLPTGDEGLLMLQAKHIWQGKELPLLFWAQPYTFPVESYLNAPFTSFLPSNAFGARILAWIWGAVSCLLALAIVRRMGRLEDVWPAYLLILFPSSYWLMIQSAYTPPSYPSYIGLFFLAILFAQLSRQAESPPKNLVYTALSGGVAGLACSVALLAAPLLVGLGLFFVMGGSFKKSFRQGVVFVVAAGIGLVPQIMARTMIPGAYGAVSGYRSLPDTLASIWETAVQWTLTGAFGIRYSFFPDLTRKPLSWVTDFAEVFYLVWLVLFGSVVVLGLYRLIHNTRKRGWLYLDLVNVFSIVAVLGIFLFGISNRALSQSYRYLLPVVMCFPFQIAYLYRNMNRPIRFIIGGLTLFLVCINLVHSVKVMKLWRTPDFGKIHAEVPSVQPVIDFLDQKNIRYAYGSWFSAHRITYATDERIISGQYYNERFYGWPTPYKDMIDQQKEVAFILDPTRRLSPKNYEEEMERVFPQATYNKTRTGFYTVYTDFDYTPAIADIRIDPETITIAVSENPERAGALQDRDLINRWHTGARQKAGMYIDLMLDHEQPVSRINLYYNTYHRSQAKKLNVLAEQDGRLVMVKEGIDKNVSFIEMKNGHPVVGDVIQEIHLTPTMTRRLRIEIAEPDSGRDWSVGEIKVFRLKGNS